MNSFGVPLQGYAHAFEFTASPNFFVPVRSFGTVMFPFSGGVTERIDKYSNPLVTLFREPTGSVDFANVARRVSENTTRVASFENEPSGVTASIEGVSTIDPNRNRTYFWDAATSCGTPPYTYQWSANFNGFDYILIPDAIDDEYSFIYNRQSQIRLKGLSVVVTDNTGNTTTAFKTVTYRDELGVGLRSNEEVNDGIILSEDLTTSVFPNPAKDRLTVGINGENTEGVSIELIDGQGKVISTPVNVFSENRQVLTEFDTQRISSGLYLLKIIHSKNITTKKVIIQK